LTKIKSIPKRLADKYRIYELGVDSSQQNESVTRHSNLVLDDGANPHGATTDDIPDTSSNRYVTDAQTTTWNTAATTVRTNTVANTNYTVLDTDRNIECSGAITITLPLLANITHYEDITISNTVGTNTITINTTGGEYLADATTFDLYVGESLTIHTGSTKYLVK
jgi:hypothetical protein